MPYDGTATKDRLLAAAEKLFAEYGIEAVSPRQIALAAGQLNQSAIHYHFGTKDALIEALLLRRMAEINARRRMMLSTLEREGQREDIHALVEAIALPLAEKVRDTPEGSAYVRFLAHLFADRERRDVLIAREQEAAPLRRIYKLLRLCIPELPEPVWNERLRMVVGGIIHALAERERLRVANTHGAANLSDAAFVSNLIDVGIAILTVPLSAATRCELERRGKKSRKEEAHVAHG